MSGQNCDTEFLELVHFNPDVPQNHNILCTNLNSKYMKIYDKPQWKQELSNKVVYDAISNCYLTVIPRYTELLETKKIGKVDRFEKVLFDFNYNQDKIYKERAEIVKLFIYNNRHMVIN